MSEMDQGATALHKADQGTERNICRALGLCARARGLIFGTSMVCEALQKGRGIRLVLVAQDVSANTAKRISDKCAYYGVRKEILPLDGDHLAHAVGKTSSLAAVGLTDENFCRLVEQALPTPAASDIPEQH
jgi:ribosomal protein L7Ae-like RNA K-turn-binding protein